MISGQFFPGTSPNRDTKVPVRSTVIDSSQPDAIVIPTLLSMQRDAISYWNNMTCFFDRWWAPSADIVTLPFCFFHVLKYSEIHNTEVSKKRVILYEPPNESSEETIETSILRHSAMQTVVDNIVVQPKSYKVELVVPFMPFSRYVNAGIQTVNMFKSTLNQWKQDAGDDLTQGSLDLAQEQFSSVFSTTRLMQNAVNDQNGALMQEAGEAINGSAQVNKNSLDAMIGKIITFKTWMGNDRKYCLITNKTAEKRGTEDDVWRVSIEMQEMPILSLTPVRGRVDTAKRGWMVKTVNTQGAIFGYPRIAETIPAFTQQDGGL